MNPLVTLIAMMNQDSGMEVLLFDVLISHLLPDTAVMAGVLARSF